MVVTCRLVAPGEQPRWSEPFEIQESATLYNLAEAILDIEYRDRDDYASDSKEQKMEDIKNSICSTNHVEPETHVDRLPSQVRFSLDGKTYTLEQKGGHARQLNAETVPDKIRLVVNNDIQ